MNVARVVASVWLAAALLLTSNAGSVDATTATCARPSAHHAFHSYDHTPSTINALSPATQRSLAAAESSLAASEALHTFATWNQLRRVQVDVYKPKKDQDASVYDSATASAQVCDAREGVATDKCDRSAWFQPQEAALGLVDACPDLSGPLACADEKEQGSGYYGGAHDLTETEGENELLLAQSECMLFSSEQHEVDMDEIDKVLAVLEGDDVEANESPLSFSLTTSSSSSRVLARNDIEDRGRDANPNDTSERRQFPTKEPAQLAGFSARDLLPASETVTTSREALADHSSASSSDWIDSLEVKNLSSLLSALERSSEPAQQQQQQQQQFIELLEMPVGKIDARVLVPAFSVRIEGRAATPVQLQHMVPSSWMTSVKAASEFLVGPPLLFAARPQVSASREERVERWKQKRKTRQTAAVPRREPEAALSDIRRAIAAKRQRVGGRFVSSGASVVASFVPITALQM